MGIGIGPKCQVGIAGEAKAKRSLKNGQAFALIAHWMKDISMVDTVLPCSQPYKCRLNLWGIFSLRAVACMRNCFPDNSI